MATVSPSWADTVVVTSCTLKATAVTPLPSEIDVLATFDTDGATRISTLPSGLICGVTCNSTPTLR